MPRVPGSFNGGIPANIVWDENNPPSKNHCSGQPTIHAPNCDGKCESTLMKEHEVELCNEHYEWARVGMNPGQIMINQTAFDMDVRINALTEFLAEKGMIDMDELNEFYTYRRIARMQKIRHENEDAAKRARLGLPSKPQILGPDGQAL